MAREAKFTSRATDGRMNVLINTDMDYELAKIILDIILVQNTEKSYTKDPISVKFEINASNIENAKRNASKRPQKKEEHGEKPDEPNLF